MNNQRVVLRILVSLLLVGSWIEAIEITQTNYSLVLTDSPFYHVFEEKAGEAICSFVWENVQEEQRAYALTLKVKDNPLRLSSDFNEHLSCTFHFGDELNNSVNLYDGNNFTQAALWVNKQEGERKLQFNLRLKIPARQIVPPGSYSIRVDLCLHDSDGKELALKEVLLSLRVTPSYQLEALTGFGAGGQHQTIDFGELSMQSTQSAEIAVSSNASYSLYVESFNRGKLKMAPMWQKSSYQSIEIPYSVVCAGSSMNLDGEASLVFRSLDPSCTEGVRYPLTITIYPDVSKHWEGEYTDELIFTIFPNN